MARGMRTLILTAICGAIAIGIAVVILALR
jgi:hypothetical protein